ncbi:hypothetical protein [Flavobacterium orientale]|uniref:Uncharacterized protein n=1 Tax=Flavobacterium orientale TaxID=1756020 RepID=A0A916Y2Y2_9FLAO|nr:hypothetical protein [Flavobacterium orientale]GGD27585.1 hypothetical protein GCM10011343_17200 [Flavobacterium orientale]
MKFWKSIVSVFFIAVISCGSEKPGGNFSRDGVSFTYPSGWSITEEGDLDGTGYYLSVEKEGFDASGLLTLTWVTQIPDSKEYLEIIQEEYKQQKILKDLKFQSVRDNNFNGIPSLSSDFKFNTFGLEHKGTIYVFVKGKNTYSIIKQEAIEDISKNQEGFDLIEGTFKVE